MERKKPPDNFEAEIEALYRANRAMVLQTAYRHTGNSEDAEDVLHAVFLRLIERPEIQEEFCRNPKGYLYKAALNEARDLQRAREVRNRAAGELGSADKPAVGLSSRRDDDVWLVRAALARMRPEDGEILYQYYVEKYTCSEICKLRNKRLHAVLKELYRARNEFKRQIEILENENETNKKKHAGTDRQLFPKTV